MSHRLRCLMCAVFGHRWHNVPGTEGLRIGAVMCICTRCADLGWRA